MSPRQSCLLLDWNACVMQWHKHQEKLKRQESQEELVTSGARIRRDSGARIRRDNCKMTTKDHALTQLVVWGLRFDSLDKY